MPDHTEQTAVVTYHSAEIAKQAEELSFDNRLAEGFLKSGFFGDIKSSAQAVVKIHLGRAMGLSPIEAMTGIDVIQGRPAINAQVRAAKMRRAGYTWKVKRLDAKGCAIAVYQGGQEIGISEYTEDDARAAGLLGKDNWKRNPRNMYFARAIANAQRWYAPEALGGLALMDTTEAADVVEVSYSDAPEAAPEMPQIATETKRRTSKLRDKLSAAKKTTPEVIDVQPEQSMDISQVEIDPDDEPSYDLTDEPGIQAASVAELF